MIITLMNQKGGLNKLSKLPDDGDPWAPKIIQDYLSLYETGQSLGGARTR